MNKINIMQESWDYMIILDACRYDYFENIYEKYFEGQLTRKLSVGSATPEWRDNSFTNFYHDVVYVSSNPFISSLNSIKGFHAKDHFLKVYNVWHTGWDHETGTVHPKTVNMNALYAVQQHPDKRIIIHYLQPHAPYIAKGYLAQGFESPHKTNGHNFFVTLNRDALKNNWKRGLYKVLALCLKKMYPQCNHPDWLAAQFLRLPPHSPMDAVRRKLGKKGLQTAYQENLHLVLQHVQNLIKHLTGKIIITSDHGELLGENNCFAHGVGSQHPLLIEVPWLIIQRPESQCEPIPKEIIKIASDSIENSTVSDEQTLTKKLEDLGYM